MTRDGGGDESDAAGDESDATGFAYTRRWVLRTGAVGVATAVAGCGHDEGGDASPTSTSTASPTTTRTEPAPEQVAETGLVDEGLTVVSSALVDDPYRAEFQRETGRQIRTERYVRVLVRNDRDEAVGAVTLSVDLFDDSRRFLEVQLASIDGLRSGEVFEGYVPFFNRNAELYVIRARRSRRRSQPQQLPDISLSDHCLADEGVQGTVTNDGDAAVERLRVKVTFLGGSGNSLGTAERVVPGLDSAESREFAVDFGPLLDEKTASVSDYAIAVGDYGAGPLSVR